MARGGRRWGGDRARRRDRGFRIAARCRAAARLVLAMGSLGFWGCSIDGMVFQPSRGATVTPEQLGLLAEDVFLDVAPGERAHAYWLPAPRATRALLYLHGNAGNASDRLPLAARLLRLETHVLLLDYRGYGRSDGRPSEAGAYADARAALAHLVEARGLRPKRIIPFGHSLGGAIAVDLARGRELGGVILESSFTSLADVVDHLYFPPLGRLVRGRFASIRKIPELRAPLLCLHGDRDRVIPIELGRRLCAAAPPPKAFVEIPGAGHNDTAQVGGGHYLRRIRAFLDQAAPPGASPDPAPPRRPPPG